MLSEFVDMVSTESEWGIWRNGEHLFNLISRFYSFSFSSPSSFSYVSWNMGTIGSDIPFWLCQLPHISSLKPVADDSHSTLSAALLSIPYSVSCYPLHTLITAKRIVSAPSSTPAALPVSSRAASSSLIISRFFHTFFCTFLV